jgi:histone H3/H4
MPKAAKTKTNSSVHDNQITPSSNSATSLSHFKSLSSGNLSKGIIKHELPDNLSIIRYKEMFDDYSTDQMKELDNVDNSSRMNELPLARIKKIMKSDSSVRMISSEAPVIFGKACELFILDLTIRALANCEKEKDSSSNLVITRLHVAQAINQSECFDFLADVVPLTQPNNNITSNNDISTSISDENKNNLDNNSHLTIDDTTADTLHHDSTVLYPHLHSLNSSHSPRLDPFTSDPSHLFSPDHLSSLDFLSSNHS